jgi:molybdopterin-containing oxidoreductase family iron-sulfur binding subunit
MACKQANCTPPGVFWSRVLRGEMGEFPNSVRQALPVLCMQCEEPDCLKVCPTGATYQTEDKIVRVDKEKCIGCKYCMMACPYGARYSVAEYGSYFPKGLPISDYEKHCMQVWEEKRGLGVATKCDFCIDRRAEGKEPACVQSCPAKARIFGDLDDPESELSYLIKTKRGFVLRPEVGTEPKVYYLPPR